MRYKRLVTTFLGLALLVGCTNNEEAQPRIGDNDGQVSTAGNRTSTTNAEQPFDHPFNHNYNGKYSGSQEPTTMNDLQSAHQVAERARAAAEQVSGVGQAAAVAQGIDIVVGIEPSNRRNFASLEQKVQQAVADSEQGYNVFVTADPDIHEQIEKLFTNMNNVKTSQVTPGISRIIYDIGQKNGAKER